VQRGFILQPTYRLEGGRPVVHLYGRLEDGRSFLIRDRRAVPHFYIEATDAERGRTLGAVRQVASSRMTMTAGRPVVRLEVDAPADTRPLRDALADAGIRTWEADVRFAMRYLIDRGIRGSLEIGGQGRVTPGVGVVFDEPELAPADWTPSISVLSIDIETDPRARRLLSVGLHGCGASETLLLTPPGWSCPEGARPFGSEKELLAGFARRVRELDPDVITGWNVVDFDLACLTRIADQLRVQLPLGRDRGGPGTPGR
jgi:DNA polymerase-2